MRMMRLPRGEQRALRAIGADIRRTDPALAAMMAIFGRLAAGADMPSHERQPRAVARAFAALLTVVVAVLLVAGRTLGACLRGLVAIGPVPRNVPYGLPGGSWESPVTPRPWRWYRLVVRVIVMSHLLRFAATCATIAVFMAAQQGSASAGVVNGPSPSSTTRLCTSRAWKYADHGRYLIRNDVFQPRIAQCLWNPRDRAAFKVITFHRFRDGDHVVGSYPSIVYGCDMFDACSEYSALPIRVAALKSVVVTVATRFARNRRQQANDASDNWFTAGPLDGPSSNRAELMLWIRYRNIHVRTDAVGSWGGVTWDLAWWVTHQGHNRWWLLQARAVRQRSDLDRYQVMPVIRFFRHLGLIRSGWRMSSADWGFECWDGCRGDRITRYSVEVTAQR